MNGPTVNFEHEHMAALGMDTPPKAGTPVSLRGDGKVLSSGSHLLDGAPRHHMTVQLHKAQLKKRGVGAKLYGKPEVDAGVGE